MSNGDFDSFTTLDELDEVFTGSFDSSQDTAATEQSDAANIPAIWRQTYRQTEDNVLRNVGLGAGPLGAHQAQPTRSNIRPSAGIYADQATYISQEDQRPINDQPWTHLIHQFDPLLEPRRSTASGSWRLNYQGQAVFDLQTQSSYPPPGISSWRPPYNIDTGTLDQVFDSSAYQQPSTPSPGERRTVQIQAVPPSTSSGSTRSSERHWCPEPDCNTSCSRADDLRRHHRTVHGDCASGPFWLCEVQNCGHWEYDRRRDKMDEHCRDRPHDHITAHGRYRYHQVQSVSYQNHAPKTPTSDKLVRRRKKRLG